MLFALSVHGSPASSQASMTALRFARAALAAGHGIHRVFFFHDGVETADCLAVPPSDAPGPLAGWVDLARTAGVELTVCVSAALRRGIVDADARARHGLDGTSLHPAFSSAGLGQLVEALAASDRHVSFAA
ncbi:MAG: sulfurtransferase complex subunit TusD [Pseudomonadales bacterium]|nr:sulfurtransferase complex subunit TusD [Pseudomonadales bacterium]